VPPVEDILSLNGEIVVNGELLEGAPEPFLYETDGKSIVMVPVRAVAEALGFAVLWFDDESGRGVRFGENEQRIIWIGKAEVQVGRAMPFDLSTAPQLVNGRTFVPLDFFSTGLAQQGAYWFEGQVVIETETDME
jgi:hypothetical protein